MSGMLDMPDNGGAHVNTVSACYAEKSIDERPFIEAVVKQTDAVPYYVFPRAEDIFAHAAEIIWHQEEPFGSTSIFAQWCVFDAARRAGIKVMLDGQGADEQLAGYHACFPVYIASLLRSGHFGTALRTLRERREFHNALLGEQFSLILRQFMPEGVVAWARRQREFLTRHNWLGSHAHDPVRNDAIGVSPRPRDIGTLCTNMTFVSNLPSLLHWEDRNSMAQSIEARVPFLDHPLVEFSLALGGNHKLVRSRTKSVLRLAMQGILPPAVRERSDKLSFVTPEQVWFRGSLKRMVVDGIEATLQRYPNLLNPAGTRALAADMLDGRRPVDSTLWRIVSVGLWGERFAVSI
jgi:asparagine synthase (glutamine-hydrolysing)